MRLFSQKRSSVRRRIIMDIQSTCAYLLYIVFRRRKQAGGQPTKLTNRAKPAKPAKPAKLANKAGSQGVRQSGRHGMHMSMSMSGRIRIYFYTIECCLKLQESTARQHGCNAPAKREKKIKPIITSNTVSTLSAAVAAAAASIPAVCYLLFASFLHLRLLNVRHAAIYYAFGTRKYVLTICETST
uniref:Uncharacterized protein n=1 Tax=Glossina brevipalpis TaxID=37001 RepID=A0A1A9WIL0_9MUSC